MNYLEKRQGSIKEELEALKARLDELEKINDESEDEEVLTKASEELDALKTKKAELEAELEEINAEIEALEPKEEPKVEDQPQRKMPFIKMETRKEENKMNIEERKVLAENFVKTNKMTIGKEETRATLVSSGNVATPTSVSGINELAPMGSIVDMVNVVDCEGMGTNKIAYEFTAPQGGITVEGETYNEGETVFGVKTIAPQTITTLAYISKQVLKQSPLAYQAKVEKNAKIALRRAVSKLVVDTILADDLKVEKTITAIDASTLRDIALSYGGSEEVEGNAVALMNKATLVKLGAVRGTNEKKAVLEITPDANPNVGTIKDGGLSVRYALNENLGDDTIIYGQPTKFELDLFSNYEVKVSEDFKFDKGLLAIRGDVEVGGAIAFKDGFIVATIGE